MKFKHYLFAAGLLLAGAATTAMVAAEGDNPEVSADYVFAHMFMPEEESTISSVAEIMLGFPNLPEMNNDEFMATFMTVDPETQMTKISASNGEDTYMVVAMPYNLINPEAEDFGCLVLGFSFLDSDFEYVDPVPNGQWTITFDEGAFVYDEMESPKFSVTYNLVSVTASETPLELLSSSPKYAATVKQLGTIKLTWAVFDQEAQIVVNPKYVEDYDGLTLQMLNNEKGEWQDKVMVLANKIGEPDVTEENGIVSALTFSIPFTPQDKEGIYRLVIPKGFFYEVKYDAATDSWVKFEGYKQNDEVTLMFEVSPNAIDPFEMVFDPEYGSTVESLNGVKIEFPNLGLRAAMTANLTDNYGQANILASNEEADLAYVGSAELITISDPDYAGNTLVMALSFLDEEYEPVEAFANGNWMITFKEGTFTYEGENSIAFEVEYRVEGSVSSEPFEITGFLPAENTPVKELSTISLVADVKDGGLMVMGNKAMLSEATLTAENGDVLNAESFGNVIYSDDQTKLIMPIVFPTVAEAGVYTLNVPEGLFVQSDLNDAWEQVPVEGGAVNAAATGKFIVDPTLVGPFDNWTFVPAAGSTVKTLDGILLQFPELEAGAFGISEEIIGMVIATNDNVTYEGVINVASGYDCETLKIYDFFDYMAWAEGEFTPGEWTVKIYAGAFSYNGEASPEFTAEFTIGSEEENDVFAHEFDPASGSTVETLDGIQLIFPNVGMLEGGQTFLQTMPGMSAAESATATNGEITYLVGAAVLPLLPEYEEEEYDGPIHKKIMKLFFIDESDEEGDGFVHEFAAGEWTINFPEGTFAYDPTGATPYAEGEEGETSPLYSPAFSATYYVEGGVVSLPEVEGILLSPEDGTVKKALSSIEVLVPAPDWYIEATPVKGTESSITLTTEDGEIISATSYGDVSYTDVDGMGYMSIAIEFPEVTEEGEYVLNIPAGTIMVYDYSEDWENGTVIGTNPDLTATYTVDPTVAGIFEIYSLNPQPGSSVVTLNGIQMMFPEISEDANVNANYGTITATNGEVTYYGYAQRDYNYYGCKVLNIYFVNDWWEPEIFDGGTWTMTIKEGAFSYLGEKNAEIVAEYTVYAQSEEPLALEDTFPANNAEVKALNVINLMYQLSEGAAINVDMEVAGYIDLMVNDGWAFGYFEIGDPSELSNGWVNVPLMIEDVYGELGDGEYEITFPQGLFYETKYNEVTGDFTAFDGYKASAEFTLNFTVNSEFAGVLDSYTLVPADNETVTSLDEVTLSFNNVPEYMYVQQNYMSEEEITLTNDEVVYTGWISMAGGKFRITFFDAEDEEAVVGNGKWTLTIPASYFTFNGEESPAIVATYTVDDLTGINGVNAESNKVTVVTTDGRVVLQNASADKLNNLDKGIYIINGKKVVIRK